MKIQSSINGGFLHNPRRVMKGVEYFADGDEAFWKFGALYQGRTIARLKANVIDKQTIELGDIQIYSKKYFQKDTPWWKRLFVKSDFRVKGIGRTLMASFLVKAKREGFTTIVANLNEHDPKETNYLLAWYTRLGFDVTTFPESMNSNFKYSITKQLN